MKRDDGVQLVLGAILRSIVAFLLLLAMTRCLGRKALSQMTFFDFSVVITFGSVAASIGIGQENTLISSVTVLITIGLLGLLTGILHIKSFRFRKLVNSEPLILIENGQIVDVNMRKGRITVNELQSMLRFQQYFHIGDVHYAILENSGTLSVMPKAENKPLTPKDMQMAPQESGLTKDIIIDGKIMHENLVSANLNEEWLLSELKKLQANVSEVFYAGLASNGSLYISKRTYMTNEMHGVHGIE